MKVLFWFLFLPFAVLATVFAVNNRGEVALGLDPFPYTLTLPIYLAVLLAALAGFLLGAALVWFAQGKWRHLARRHAKQASALERDLAEERGHNARRAAATAETVSSVAREDVSTRE